jgi:hypothetical protein
VTLWRICFGDQVATGKGHVVVTPGAGRLEGQAMGGGDRVTPGAGRFGGQPMRSGGHVSNHGDGRLRLRVSDVATRLWGRGRQYVNDVRQGEAM